MPTLISQADLAGPEADANEQALRAQVGDLRTLVARLARGGGERARARHVERGKLLPRQRLEALLDPGTPFLELSPLAADCSRLRSRQRMQGLPA